MPNKAQFIDQLAERLDGDRKRAAAALDAVIDTVYAAIARGEKVAISGFGNFERRERAARTARNPATGARVNVAASRVPAFRPGKEFKEIASGAREYTQERAARAQAVVTKAAGVVRDAQDRAASAVREAVGDVLEAPGKAAAAVANTPAGRQAKKAAGRVSKKSAPVKAAKKAAAKSAPAKSAPATKKAAAKKLAAKATSAPVKKAAAKKLASGSGPAKKAAAKKA